MRKKIPKGNRKQMNKDVFLSKLVDNSSSKNIFDEMRKEMRPLIMWGAGSMSVSVRKLLEKEDIRIDAFWIDNCEVDTNIDGIPIMNMEDLMQKYEKINVVFGHSKYELADEISKKYSFINKCYCLVNVCYGQWKRIEYNFVKEHIEEYMTSYNMLSDERSKECFIAYLNCKMSEDFRYLLGCCDEKASYFSNPFFRINADEWYVDIGAYNGDTIREFLDTVDEFSGNIYAIEPENESFEELSRMIEEMEVDNVELFQCGCWNENTVLKFAQKEESSSIDAEGTQELQVYTLDSLLDKQRVTMIKINFLYGVAETILGATEILKTYHPKLAITVGFDEWGIIRIPQIIKEIDSDYKIYLRYAAAMPARLILFAC